MISHPTSLIPPKALWSESDLPAVQQAIQDNLEAHLPFLTAVVNHAVAPKTLSPYSQVTLHYGRHFGVDSKTFYDLTSVIEYLHIATELHTNIRNTAQFRRSQVRLDSIWRNEASILLGDYLLSVGFQTLTRLGNLDVIQTVSEATRQIACGQILEVTHYDQMPSEKRIEVIQHKQSSLMAAAALSAGYFGNHQDLQTLHDEVFQKATHHGLVQDLMAVQQKESLQKALDSHAWLYPLCLLQETYDAHNITPPVVLKTLFDEASISQDTFDLLQQELNHHGIFQQITTSLEKWSL